uniref:Glutathione synthetase n=1 Tax=Paulinella micropora TaxID=1928728 RepID=A0A385I051_9EUKA|nr:glutathione synthetase [Paulinella micropora]AXY63281.1 glutathione synthetase [Paulinella micropora]
MAQLFVIDPIQHLNPTKDSSVALMQAVQKLGEQVWICTQGDIMTHGQEPIVCSHPITFEWIQPLSEGWQVANPWYRIGEIRLVPLTDFSCVWMRKDPPVDELYIYATHLLELGERKGVRIINKPVSLRSWNEKLGALRFSELMAPTLVANRLEPILAFANDCDEVVLKPLGGKGGQGVVRSHSKAPGFRALLELVTQQQQVPIMIQAFLPAVTLGDKRIILANGTPLGAINRKPLQGEFRSNLAVGGYPESTTLTEEERIICNKLSPILQSEGLAFVGIDVIDGYLSEINVTSPTGVREVERIDGVQLSDQIVKKLLYDKAY